MRILLIEDEKKTAAAGTTTLSHDTQCESPGTALLRTSNYFETQRVIDQIAHGALKQGGIGINLAFAVAGTWPQAST